LSQVLLVDDNPLQLSVREAVLRTAGFQVSVATTAESALATLRVFRDRVRVVVTDHLMPGCSGSELVRQIRGLDLWLPIIVLSGLPDSPAGLDRSPSIQPRSGATSGRGLIPDGRVFPSGLRDVSGVLCAASKLHPPYMTKVTWRCAPDRGILKAFGAAAGPQDGKESFQCPSRDADTFDLAQ